MAGPTRGNAGGPACSAPARKAVTARDRARAPTRPSSRVTVLAHGAAPAVRPGAGAEPGQFALAGVPDPGGDVGRQRLAVQHRRDDQPEHAGQGVAPAPGAARVGHERQAVQDAAPGRRAQLRDPFQQLTAGLAGCGAQPLRFRERPVALAGSPPLLLRVPTAAGAAAAGRAAQPPFLPFRGAADGFLGLRDHRLGGVGGCGHARLAGQRGLLAGKGSGEMPLVLSEAPLPCPRRNKAVAEPGPARQLPVTETRLRAARRHPHESHEP